MKINRKACSFFVSFLVSAIVSLIVFFLTYNISCWLSPPHIIDEGGETHPVMPIGQVMIAGILSGILGIISLIVVFKKGLKRKWN